jgi:hypothetical protein
VADVIKNHADQFVNFNSLPETGQLKSTFYDWKWGLATNADGKTVVLAVFALLGRQIVGGIMQGAIKG